MSETLAPEDLGASPTADAPAPEPVCLPGARDSTPSVDLDFRVEEEEEGKEIGREGGVGSRRRYGREEMEAMRFATAAALQQQRWKEVYQGMGEAAARGYDELRVPNSRKKNKKKKKPGAKENEVSLLVGQEFDATSTRSSNEFNPSDLACGDSGLTHEDILVVEEECCEYDDICNDDDSSEDEYDSIRKPAFFVEGEPDFDSGPPLDGLEYLRRVRWEASQIPKVKVAKLKPNGQVSEQTSYMPKIPEITTCPSHLLPSKHWEEAFLAYFKELRKAFLSTEDSFEQPLVLRHDEHAGEDPVCTQMPMSAPTMTVVRGMDAVTRAAKLRNYISLLESSNMLPAHDCQWLFALSVAVDTPLDADTSASLRCLLRKCSNMLAKKSKHDDEVAMLNILITITGKYFGQSERRVYIKQPRFLIQVR